jgi:RNA 2',3'-cyclic 3'-phosphodiesterase
MPTIRTFIALPTVPEIQNQIATIQAELKGSQADVKWDSPDKFHITLKFLGDVESSQIDQISSSITSLVKAATPFEVIYHGVGAFPNLHNPRVIWIGITPQPVLIELQTKLESACVELGFPPEERPFHPHITLGRVKGNRNIDCLTEATKTCTFEPMKMHCPEVVLMKSDLRPGGSIYTILDSFPFQL